MRTLSTNRRDGPQAGIPPQIQELLAPFLPSTLPWTEVDLRFQNVSGLDQIDPHNRISRARVKRSVQAVTLSGLARSLRTIGMTIGRTIFMDPRSSKLKDAASLALLGHELVHVNQFETIPNFEALYDFEARQTPESSPWLNKYEYPAYEVECRIWHALIADGVPKGSWTPLGVSQNLCAA